MNILQLVIFLLAGVFIGWGFAALFGFDQSAGSGLGLAAGAALAAGYYVATKPARKP